MSNESIESEGDEVIDPRVFIKQLPPDQLGMFEPLSGLMLLNMSKAELLSLGKRYAARELTELDHEMIRTINHEAYHFAQAAASGYVFHREARLMMVFNSSEPVPDVQLDPETEALLNAAREDAGDDPELLHRYEQMVTFIVGHRQLELYDAVAGEGDHSVMGALVPGFFAHMTELAEDEMVKNQDGLSVLGVLEGSAVVHVHLLIRPGQDVRSYVEDELGTLPPVYRELYDLTLAHAGSRALELILPATTLALRYAAPHNAYLPLLSMLQDAPPGEGLEFGRTLSARLPEIPGAGPIFGTALDLRRMHDGYRLYDEVLGKLERLEWGIDSYSFLAEPSAMRAIQTFPLGIVTNDGYLGALDQDELAARMAMMGGVLRSQSRRRAEREFRRFQANWAISVLNRLMGVEESGADAREAPAQEDGKV